MKSFIFVCLACIFRAAAAEEDPLVVQTKQGSLVGTEITSDVKNLKYFAFFNIPYAQKPIGDKRFKSPEEPLPWEGVRDATEMGNTCLSMNPIFQTVDGDEDCLNLNVYTQKPPKELQESPRPVMFWIHGGAFHMGSNTPLIHGPDFLMMEDIVLVAINYRLNAFGFLSLQNEEVPGNAGLKDQVMALKWVKENIRAFGGDPKKVTIFGESAGGASVHYLMLSPMARGLFQRAILQSGTALSPWAKTKLTIQPALKLGEVFDCPTEDLSELVKCLQGVPASELATHEYNVVAPKVTEPVNLKVFLPCIEPNASKNPFIAAEPRQLLINGHYTDVPFIIGTTEMETLFLSRGDTIPEKLKKRIYSAANKDPSLILTTKLDDVDPPLREKVGKEIKDFFFKDAKISEDTIINIINVTTDLNFLLGTYDAVTYHLRHGSSPVYQYHFTLDTSFAAFKKMLGTTIKGPGHSDDVSYLFYMQMAPQEIDENSPGYKGMLKMVKLWTNFAKFGNPTPDGELQIEWKPVTAEGKFYLEIGEELTLKEDLQKERMQFWDNLRMRENLPDF